MLNEQFRPSRETVSYTATGHYRGNYIATPYDTDARRSTKPTTQWVGYKLHVTETISTPQQSRFITDLVLAAAPEPDNQQPDAIQNRLAERRVLPAKQYVDQGYMSAANLAKSLTKGGGFARTLVAGHLRQARGFPLTGFSGR